MVVKTSDHPEANGRQPNEGDVQYEVYLPLENGDTLHILMGEDGHEAFKSIFVQEYIDTEVEKIFACG